MIGTSADGRLDALAFLEGCWRHWSVDWGFSLCWRRHAAEWVGEVSSSGPMGPTARVVLHIVPGVRTLVVSATGTLGQWFDAGLRNVEATVVEHNHVVFADGPKVLELRLQPSTRKLLFRPWKHDFAYALDRD